ncbi:MAG: trypsin-like peptidase domain-containing protein [Candidatus Bathyarchaeota archaeon]|nr:trypsin-like peptidase domain-containing protein [Candidatus Bathyarchaeota archaeon]
METTQPPTEKAKPRNVFPAVIVAVLLTVSLVGAAGIYSLNEQVSSLQSQIASLQSTVQTSQYSGDVTTVASETSLSNLYDAVENSVVTIECTIVQYSNMPWMRQTSTTSSAQGSGFVYQYNGEMVIITNNHVIEDASTITVTFADGNSYTATLLGADASTDIAVLKADAPTSEYYPLDIISSDTLSVGDAVVALGSPYGLTGTMTSGIISALDRTITVTETSGSYEMTGLIQTSAPINSGNSGGPLMTYNGKVIGITTAIVSNSDGLGFAVPSDTILSVVQDILA